MNDQRTGVRTAGLPIPNSISAEAQAVLALPFMSAPPFPAIDDLAGWRENVAAVDAQLAVFMAGRQLPDPPAVERIVIAGVTAYHAIPHGVDAAAPRIFLDLHGGGLIYMGGEAVGSMAGVMAGRLGMRVISVDYRMPPDHLYPAALDDAVAVYRALVAQWGAGAIIIGGTSAGGNLAAALVLRARDEGLPLPAACVLLTPEVDLTESGDTFQTLAGLDRLRSLIPVNRLYAGGASLNDPYLSPLFGDFSKGFAPTFLQSGTRDLYLSNTVRMHRALRRANIRAELHVWEAMLHGGFGGTPEDAEMDIELRRFIASAWGTAERE